MQIYFVQDLLSVTWQPRFYYDPEKSIISTERNFFEFSSYGLSQERHGHETDTNPPFVQVQDK